MKKDEWLCSLCGESGKEHFDLWTLEDGGVLVVCSVCRMGYRVIGATDEEMKEMFAEEAEQP